MIFFISPPFTVGSINKNLNVNLDIKLQFIEIHLAMYKFYRA